MFSARGIRSQLLVCGPLQRNESFAVTNACLRSNSPACRSHTCKQALQGRTQQLKRRSSARISTANTTTSLECDTLWDCSNFGFSLLIPWGSRGQPTVRCDFVPEFFRANDFMQLARCGGFSIYRLTETINLARVWNTAGTAGCSTIMYFINKLSGKTGTLMSIVRSMNHEFTWLKHQNPIGN